MDVVETKVRENLARRMAKRQGLALVKNRRRDPRALGYGTFGLVRGDREVVTGLSLEQVEARLIQAPRRDGR